jgi:transposase InsO family protein
MLEGRQFVVFPDHPPLLGALGRVSEPWSARQQRQLSYIAEFTADIRHIAGQSNRVADTLSRPAAAPADTSSLAASLTAAALPQAVSPAGPAASPPVDLQELAAAQASCHDCQKGKSSPVLRVLDVAIGGSNVLVDVSSGIFRPRVPAIFRRRIFEAVHNLAHPGIRTTRRLISSRYVWPNLAADVKKWCQDCSPCQTAKVTRQPAAAVQSIPVPATRFTHLHLDLVGPLPASADGCTHILTVVDRSTRWAEATPLRSTSAAACLEALAAAWFARYSIPATITTDRGSLFTSGEWAAALQRLGIQHILTTAFHPQSNGLVERFHRRLKEALKARLAGPAWPSHLPWVMLGLHAAPREDSGILPAELTFGAALSLPAAFITSSERSPETFLRELQSFLPCASPLSATPASSRPPAAATALDAATHVYVRAPPAAPALSPAYRGLYRVLWRGPKFYWLAIGGREDTC